MRNKKSVFSWALYDWANSAFATVVLAGFFPVVFKSYWANDLSTTENTFWLGLGNGAASLILVCLAPLLGVLGDRFHCRKRLLVIFMLFGVSATGALMWQEQSQWIPVLILYITATFSFMSANIYYDALLVPVSQRRDMEYISSIGYSLGYLGGGIALAACIYLSQNPDMLSFDTSIDAALAGFGVVAVWWFLFSLPLILWVQDGHENIESKVKNSLFREAYDLLKEVFRHQQTRWFLFAYWLYIDGVDTIVRMAVDYGMSLGFESSDLISALLITQFVGFPAAIVYGYFGKKIGARKAILAGICVYALICLLGYNMVSITGFYILAVLIGLVQGGVQAMSRSLFAQMIPANKEAEYFGVYNMLGKSAAIIGPVLMGSVAVLTDSHRQSILSILLLFLLGAIMLMKVEEPKEQVL